jgi:hypothetical protein
LRNHPRSPRRVSPLLIASAAVLLFGSMAGASLSLRPQPPARTAPPLAPEDATGSCPRDERRSAGVRLASAQEATSAAQETAAQEAPAPNPEGKNSRGCVGCHEGVEPSHASQPSALEVFGCIGCHGGDGKELKDKEKAHGVKSRFPALWKKARAAAESGNPERTYTLLNREDPRFIRFVNPGDLRIVHETCGASGCHGEEKPVTGNVVLQVRKNLMTHGSFLLNAALYNNGAVPVKDARFGESYSFADLKNPHRPHSLPQRMQTILTEDEKRRFPTEQETRLFGWLPLLDPMPRWEVSQVGNVLRVFERGGGRKGELGNPNPEAESGRPDVKLSARGHGTGLRTDPTVLGIQKTRLFDPTLNFLGTNDQPGDYRSSGCSACHNVYANDPDPFHSAQYAQFGNLGQSFTADKALKEAKARGERGHPIRHGMTNQIPTSQCISCHMHPGTSMLTTYLGYTWWDNETDGERLYPERPAAHSPEAQDAIQRRNPEGAALRGKWGDPRFLEQELPKLNPTLKHTQFAQFNGHGWIYRAVFKRDRHGNLIDSKDQPVPDRVPSGRGKFQPNPPAPGPDAEPKEGLAVHLRDIHLEKGMQCVDCHFSQDNHGDGKLYGEPRAAITVQCTDCHGNIRQRANPTSSDETVPGSRLREYRRFTVIDGPSRLRWRVREGVLTQYSAVNPELKWEVPQVLDTITPGNKWYREASRLAKTIQRDNRTWGDASAPIERLAHTDDNMTCYTCHSAWTTSCFGCHLSMTADRKKPQLHNEGGDSRNWTSYNFQTLRDDLYMLGKEGTVPAPKDASGKPQPRVVPVRSSCAVLVSSQNQDREWIYQHQQTVSAEGFAGTAFSPYVPHTVRSKETKVCTDCHVSRKNDNNAWMANLLLQGSNAVNFIGRYCYVATGKGFEAVAVTERDEPQAVIGSYLHRLAYPDRYRRHLERRRELGTAREHEGHTVGLQQRGEYLYAAEGSRGLVVYDIANIDNKGFSERITTAPVSPLGQRLFVDTKDATAVAAPSTLALDPARTQDPRNEEGQIHPLYGYLYVTDRVEGLIVVGAATLLDGNPTNNFLKRAATWNPGGVLTGASSLQIAGRYAYVTADRGLAIVDLDDPLHPRLAAEIGAPALAGPRSVAVQFRYAFVCDREGLKVVDVTFPNRPRVVDGARVPLADARDVYVSRTRAYVAAGPEGLAIVDVEKPESPRLEERFTAGGALNDAHAVRIGMTNNSTFAYVADGKNGLRVVQLTSPATTPGIYGYAPRPAPELIATYETGAPALAVSEGLDRDRAVDESGNQLSVFGRRGARPLNAAEQGRLYLLDGRLFQVENTPPGPPVEPPAPPAMPPATEQASLGWAVLPVVILAGIRVQRRRRTRSGEPPRNQFRGYPA